MYVMQLHSAYGECVGVKGNYVPPVCFPQLDDGNFFFFCISLLFSGRPRLDLICSLADRDNRVTNSADVKEE